MTKKLLLATTLLACTPLAFAKAPSPDSRMDSPAMPDILLGAPTMPDVVIEAPQGPSQDGPQVTPPPAPPMQGHGPQGAHMHGHEGPGPGRGPEGGMEHGIIPPGTWWQNPEIVTAIGLSADQQKKIEDLFIKSRVDLIALHSILEQQQVMLEPVLNANPIDQTKALAAVDQIADTRAKLEKTDARMLLSIRAVLTPDQWTKLQAQRPHGRGPGGPDGKRGPGGSYGRRGTPPQAPPAE